MWLPHFDVAGRPAEDGANIPTQPVRVIVPAVAVSWRRLSLPLSSVSLWPPISSHTKKAPMAPVISAFLSVSPPARSAAL